MSVLKWVRDDKLLQSLDGKQLMQLLELIEKDRMARHRELYKAQKAVDDLKKSTLEYYGAHLKVQGLLRDRRGKK
jgi:hypothetical protein